MDRAPGQSRRVGSRRSHPKSRLGCKNCKRRRVKCDEKTPSCSNCLLHSIKCDFVIAPESASSARSSASTPSVTLSNRQYQFKPSKYQSLACAASGEGDTMPELGPLGTGDNPFSAQNATTGISFCDLHLFHHFVTSTYRTMRCDSEDRNGVWQVHVPQWGLSFPSILHLMLALSALHFACQQPERREECVLQATSHFTLGIRSVSSILSQLDSEICQIIYMSTVLVCFVYFGRGPQPGEYLVFSEGGRSEFLVLMRGVRSILQTKKERIFSGVLTPNEDNGPQEVSPLLRDELCEHRIHLEGARRLFMTQVASADRDIYISALVALEFTFEDAYRLRSIGKDGVSLMHLAIGWVYRLPRRLVGLLEEKDPFSLTLLAYWCILLKYMGTSWLMAGWDRHVLSGIRRFLGDEDHQHIQWPMKVIYGS